MDWEVLADKPLCECSDEELAEKVRMEE